MASAQLAKILKGKIWRFFGGINPPELKNTSRSAIARLPLPPLITLPAERHLGEGGMILVKQGDYVKAGQPLTVPGGRRNVPLHASTSGTVLSVGMHMLPHPSGYEGLSIVIKPDGKDIAVEPDPITDWQEKSAQELLERIRAYGVEGLGGAQFQTAAKLSSAITDNRQCNVFIVNGAECEPVATCDDRLMQEKAADIAQGIAVVQHILRPKVVIVAIEANKPEAIKAMQSAVKDMTDVQVRVIPALYPSGAARNLIKIVTGIEIPYKAHTSDCGIVVDNVETVFAIKQAVIDGVPLIKRVVTIAGDTLQKQGNAEVLLGTSLRFLLTQYHLKPERHQRIIIGGPMMGFTVPSIDVPVTKSATCIFAPGTDEVKEAEEAQNCIRCGRCARVCPSRLVPYLMYAYSRASDHEHAKKCGIADCTECGCCSFVCPSHIPLTSQFRREKALQRLVSENNARNAQARERMQAHNECVAKENAIREQKKQAALRRIAAQKAAAAADAGNAPAAGAPAPDADLAARRAAAVAAARERARLKREQAAQKDKGLQAGQAAPAAAQSAPAGINQAEADAIAKKRAAIIAAAREKARLKREQQATGNGQDAAPAQAQSAPAGINQAEADAIAKKRAAIIAAAREKARLKREQQAAGNGGNAATAQKPAQAQAQTQSAPEGINQAEADAIAKKRAAIIAAAREKARLKREQQAAGNGGDAAVAQKPAQAQAQTQGAPEGINQAEAAAIAKRRAAIIAAAREKARLKREQQAAGNGGSDAAAQAPGADLVLRCSVPSAQAGSDSIKIPHGLHKAHADVRAQLNPDRTEAEAPVSLNSRAVSGSADDSFFTRADSLAETALSDSMPPAETTAEDSSAAAASADIRAQARPRSDIKIPAALRAGAGVHHLPDERSWIVQDKPDSAGNTENKDNK